MVIAEVVEVEVDLGDHQEVTLVVVVEVDTEEVEADCEFFFLIFKT
jgi:hypothetical protein